jgi:hypothetical protein
VVENANLNTNSTIDRDQIVLRSYGWRQCRLMTGNLVANEGNGNEQKEQWWIVDERMIQVNLYIPYILF